MLLHIQVTIQLPEGQEQTVYRDEVVPERACPVLAIADASARSMLGALGTSGTIRAYIGPQMMRSFEC